MHSDQFRYQVFVLLVVGFVFPAMISFLRRLKKIEQLKRKRQSTPRRFGQKLFSLVSTIVEETLEGATGDIESFDKSNAKSQKLYSELSIDYLFMVFVSLKGLVGDTVLEKDIFDFVKNYYYPFILSEWDLQIEDLEKEKKLFDLRFSQYQEFIKGEPQNWLLPLARKMVSNFNKNKDNAAEVNQVISEITNVMNEVPILFFKFQYEGQKI